MSGKIEGSNVVIIVVDPTDAQKLAGVFTDGDCRPSRSVSSSSITRFGTAGAPILFQS